MIVFVKKKWNKKSHSDRGTIIKTKQPLHKFSIPFCNENHHAECVDTILPWREYDAQRPKAQRLLVPH